MTGKMRIALLVLVVYASLVSVNAQYYPRPISSANGRGDSDKSIGFWPPQRRCEKSHEVFKSCVSGSCSEWKCYYLLEGWPEGCTKDCGFGCYCKEGYFRNRWGHCVPGYSCFTDLLLKAP
uniref:TIL domain containing protein n=1 Tax=Rhipicephalus appendiculatus TaxID=34631 RepID=A0A131YTQ4_RHIAP